MTHEAWDRLLAHCKEHGVPPCGVFPDGIGCPVIVDPKATEPRYEGARVYVNPADLVDIRRRTDRLRREESLCP